MSPRKPEEIAAINALHREFLRSIEKAPVDRQIALDALEYTTWDLWSSVSLIEKASTCTSTSCESDATGYGTGAIQIKARFTAGASARR